MGIFKEFIDMITGEKARKEAEEEREKEYLAGIERAKEINEYLEKTSKNIRVGNDGLNYYWNDEEKVFLRWTFSDEYYEEYYWLDEIGNSNKNFILLD